MFDEASTIIPVMRAVRRVRLTMFKPIWLYGWFVIGLIAFAGGLVQGPSGFPYALNEDARSLVWGWLPISEADEVVAEFLMVQSGLRLVFTLPSLFGVYLLSLILLWFGSRAQLAFVNMAATNDFGIMRSLHSTVLAGRSLFMFRLGFATLAFVALTFAILSSSVIVMDGEKSDQAMMNILGPVAAAGGSIALILNVLLRNLVAPVMWRYEVGCTAAIAMVFRATKAKPLPVIVFIGVKGIWSVVIWVVWIVTGVLTCFLGFIPIVHHAICAPLYMFDRLYSMYVLEYVMDVDIVLEPEGLD